MGNSVLVHTDWVKGTINKHIYGQFAEHLGRCIYEGLWVGEESSIPNTDGIRNDVLKALQKLNIPVLRWPGGCFADEYHWKDGIGPKEQRKKMINTHWGGVVENNHFGTHEFFRLCELLGAEPYINGNVGSGTVQEMSEWIEYMTFDGESPMANWRQENGREQPWKLKYFGVGNENWGCGGNMRPEYYADLYRQFQTYVRNYGDNVLYKIAGGANVDDYHWTEVLMREAAPFMDGLSLHNYTIPGSWEEKQHALGFDEAAWFETLKKALHMDELITRHSTIMDKYDPNKRIGMIVDEWGTWFLPEPGTNPGFLYQQNTLRDALVAGLHFHIFHQHHERIHMTNIAQMVNVLQAMILTEGNKMLLTPTYHIFEMFRVHQDGKVLATSVEHSHYELNDEKLPEFTVSSSEDAEGHIHISLCHLNPNASSKVSVELRGLQSDINVTGTVLTSSSMQDHNTFTELDKVKPVAFADYSFHQQHQLDVVLPPMSVVMLTIKKK